MIDISLYAVENTFPARQMGSRNVKYSVSYDLHKPEQNYRLLWKELKVLKGRKILQSHWIVEVGFNMTSTELKNHFVNSGLIDFDDSLMVIPISGAWDGHNLIRNPNDV